MFPLKEILKRFNIQDTEKLTLTKDNKVTYTCEHNLNHIIWTQENQFKYHFHLCDQCCKLIKKQTKDKEKKPI